MYLNHDDRDSILQYDKIIQICPILIAYNMPNNVGKNQGIILKVAERTSGNSGKDGEGRIR